jgi:hypothetical protein
MDRSALLISDQQEAGHTAEAAVADAVVREPLRRPIRLVLLARTGGDWWDGWRNGLRHAAPTARSPARRHSMIIRHKGASTPRHGMSAPDRRVLICPT